MTSPTELDPGVISTGRGRTCEQPPPTDKETPLLGSQLGVGEMVTSMSSWREGQEFDPFFVSWTSEVTVEVIRRRRYTAPQFKEKGHSGVVDEKWSSRGVVP